MTFVGDRVEFTLFPGRTQSFRLDPAREPKRIDFLFHEAGSSGSGGRRREVSQPSIYQFDGENLRIVLGDDELEARPDSFDVPEKATPFIHLVLRRPTEDERKTLEQHERLQLQGTWIGVYKTIAGEPRRLESDDVKLVVKGDRLRFDIHGADPLHATFALNSRTRPWHLDLTATDDSDNVKKGQKVLGIIFRQGQMLTLAIGDSRRPASFEAAGKDGTVYALVREGVRSSYSSDFSFSPKTPVGPPPAKTDNKRLRELQQERVKALEEQMQGQFERVKIGKDPLIELINVMQELAEARLEVAENREQRLAAVESLLKECHVVEEQLRQLQAAGLQTKQGVAQAKSARLKAEIQLEKLKAEK
jgi:uncharacterized protein (TIGR03067 family)